MISIRIPLAPQHFSGSYHVARGTALTVFIRSLHFDLSGPRSKGKTEEDKVEKSTVWSSLRTPVPLISIRTSSVVRHGLVFVKFRDTTRLLKLKLKFALRGGTHSPVGLPYRTAGQYEGLVASRWLSGQSLRPLDGVRHHDCPAHSPTCAGKYNVRGWFEINI